MKRIMLRRWGLAAAAVTAATAVVMSAVPAAAAAATAEGSARAAEPAVLVNAAGETVTMAEVQAAGAVAAERLRADAWRNPSNGAVAPFSIIGPDDRVQITNTTINPYRMIVHIEHRQGWCTGFMVSRDTVLTAAHCLYDYHKGAGWIGTPYTVRPARNGGTAPFGLCTGWASDTWVPTAWIATGQQRHDYGAVKMTCNIGDQTGWFNTFANDNYSQVGSSIFTAGYPQDKPYGTMWMVGGTVTTQNFDSMNFSNDLEGGQSGSPLYRYNAPSGCSGYCAAGIVTNHAVSQAVGNLGVRFNSSNMGHVNYWISLP